MSSFYTQMLSSSRKLQIDTTPSTTTFKNISFKKTLIKGDEKEYYRSKEDFEDALTLPELRKKYNDSIKNHDAEIKRLEQEKIESINNAREKGENTDEINENYTSKIQKETLNKEETIINHKKTIEKIKNNASKHYVFNITGDALTLELNTTTEGKKRNKKIYNQRYATASIKNTCS